MVANEMAMLPASDKLTYGPVRAEVLSALFSTVIILVLGLLLLYSSIKRLIGETSLVHMLKQEGDFTNRVTLRSSVVVKTAFCLTFDRSMMNVRVLSAQLTISNVQVLLMQMDGLGNS